MRPCVVEADVVGVLECVALAGRAHVVVAVEPQLDGAARSCARGAPRRTRRATSAFPCRRSRRPCGGTRRRRRGRARRARARPCAAPRPDAASSVKTCMPPCSLRHGERDLAFEIEVILAAARERGRAADAALRRSRRRASPRATCTGGSTYDCAASASSIVRIAGSGAMSMSREPRRAPRRVDAGRGDGEHRLAGELARRVRRGSDRRAGSGRRR